ncbi:MAG: hypothetical protein V4579_14165 [Pseudomonadota bacterium]
MDIDELVVGAGATGSIFAVTERAPGSLIKFAIGLMRRTGWHNRG